MATAPPVAAMDGGNRRRTAVAAGAPMLRAGAAIAVAGLVAAWTLSTRTPIRAFADSGADSGMFGATNQDRTSNGVGALQYLGTLQNVGEAMPYNCSGIHVQGRAYDLIQRNYFSHTIQGCGQYVFSMMSYAGVSWQSAGENIGWASGFGSAGASVGYVNTEFMNSQSHRDNILNPGYTGMGVGSDWTAGPWTGGGGSNNNVSMFAELFVQQGSPPPKPTPPPPPPPTGAPPPVLPQPTFTHNQPVPTESLPPAQSTPAPTPTPVPIEPSRPSPTTGGFTPVAVTPGAPPPLELQPAGLLTDSIEAVLEGFLIG